MWRSTVQRATLAPVGKRLVPETQGVAGRQMHGVTRFNFKQRMLKLPASSRSLLRVGSPSPDPKNKLRDIAEEGPKR